MDNHWPIHSFLCYNGCINPIVCPHGNGLEYLNNVHENTVHNIAIDLITEKNIEELKELVLEDLDVNGGLVIYAAVECNDLHALHIVMSLGAKINYQDATFLYACMKGLEVIVKYFINYRIEKEHLIETLCRHIPNNITNILLDNITVDDIVKYNPYEWSKYNKKFMINLYKQYLVKGLTSKQSSIYRAFILNDLSETRLLYLISDFI